VPIIDLQRRVHEVGRIRMGAKTAKGAPTKLETWRFTSSIPELLHQLSEQYGGTVAPWEGNPGKHELYSEASSLPIVVTPGNAISQWFELWGRSASGKPVECLRRCDGETEHLGDQPCQCPREYTERNELAKDGKACKPKTRVNVILPAVGSIGVWRLETTGFYAAVELAGMVELLAEATRRGALIPATLRIEQRRVVRHGQSQTFPVPVIDATIGIRGVMDLAAGALPTELDPPARVLELNAGTVEAPDGYQPASRPAMTAAAAVRSAATQAAPKTINARSAEPITPTFRVVAPTDAYDVPSEATAAPDGETPASDPPSAVVAGEAPHGGRLASSAQAKLIHIRASKAGLSETELDEILLHVSGGASESAAGILASLVDTVLETIPTWREIK